MAAKTFVATDGGSTCAADEEDAPKVVVQVHASGGDIVEWTSAGPDAVGEGTHARKRCCERQPADNGGLALRM